ncbi:MAG: DUF4340 domain-containing protein [Alphaproteobacteria bacterium]|nr:MAG: DUF4340 domain-containing protein [Alphaproteobacteria bacterium]
MSKSARSLRENFLMVLFGLAAVTILSAVVAVGMHERSTAPAFQPSLAFPYLDGRLDHITTLRVTSLDGTLTLKRRSATNWVIEEKNNYPAEITSVRRLLIGLADLELVEAKTSRRDWYQHLGLEDPQEGGSAIRFEAFEANGELLAEIYSGMEQGLPDMNGASYRYVRLGQNPQTYLSRGQLDLGATVDVWANLDFLTLERARYQSVVSTPGAGAGDSRGFTASRATPEDYNFALQGVPLGFEPTAPGIANGVGSALSSMSILDLASADDLNFESATKLQYRTFDDIEIEVMVAEIGNQYWIQIAARDVRPEDAPEPVDAAAEAERQGFIKSLNDRTKDWAFKVPDWKGDQMVMTFSSMIQVKEAE